MRFPTGARSTRGARTHSTAAGASVPSASRRARPKRPAGCTKSKMKPAVNAPPLLVLSDVARTFDVSPPWLERILERKPRALLKAVDGVSLTIAKGETLG